jgi:hypothetical protein
MGLVTDIFRQNAWGTIDLHEQIIERVDYVPSLLGQMGIFEPWFSRSKTLAIGDRDRTVSLIPTSERGAPPREYTPEGARMRYFQPARLAEGSTVYADELQGVTELASDLQFREITREVAQRTQRIMVNFDLTMEHMRLGAVMGQVLDADGSTLVDWFDEWGVSQPAALSFELDQQSADIRKISRSFKRGMAKKAKGRWMPGNTLVNLCGDEFFDALVSHPQYREVRLVDGRTRELENIEGYSAVEFEGILHVNYRGTDDGSTLSIPSNEGRLFPRGPGFFKAAYAPASEFKPYVNQQARERYTMLLEDVSGRDEWDRVEIYSYPLMICTMPELLQRVTLT